MPHPDSDLPPPSPRSHLAPFREGVRPWLVLARNAVLVVGVYGLGWAASVAVFEIWFDGVTALGAMLALQTRAFVRRGGKPFKVPPGIPSCMRPIVLAVVWAMILLLLGIPYWFILLIFNVAVFDTGFWSLLLGDSGVIAALVLVLASNTVEESMRGYERMNDTQIRLDFNWEFSMHLARVAAMLFVVYVFPLSAIAGLALALSYVEIYPMRTLRFLGGDRTLESGNEDRSRD